MSVATESIGSDKDKLIFRALQVHFRRLPEWHETCKEGRLASCLGTFVCSCAWSIIKFYLDCQSRQNSCITFHRKYQVFFLCRCDKVFHILSLFCWDYNCKVATLDKSGSCLVVSLWSKDHVRRPFMLKSDFLKFRLEVFYLIFLSEIKSEFYLIFSTGGK